MGLQGLHPDLVVINLGTNDFSVEPKPFKSEFVASYTKILKQLRQHYGDVPILCIYCCTIPPRCTTITRPPSSR
ncbi:MAG: GDSL-type esterase/lipase family protein [Bacteroides stercoris]